MNSRVYASCLLVAIVLAISLEVQAQKAEAMNVTAGSTPEVIEEPKEVKIDLVWTKEDIVREIRETFPEAPDLAVAIAKCESGLIEDIQSQHTLSYGQERSYGVMQIHSPDWDDDAQRLGLINYKTDAGDNIKLARYIYEQAGKRFTPWSCYTKKMI